MFVLLFFLLLHLLSRPSKHLATYARRRKNIVFSSSFFGLRQLSNRYLSDVTCMAHCFCFSVTYRPWKTLSNGCRRHSSAYVPSCNERQCPCHIIEKASFVLISFSVLPMTTSHERITNYRAVVISRVLRQSTYSACVPTPYYFVVSGICLSLWAAAGGEVLNQRTTHTLLHTWSYFLFPVAKEEKNAWL